MNTRHFIWLYDVKGAPKGGGKTTGLKHFKIV